MSNTKRSWKLDVRPWLKHRRAVVVAELSLLAPDARRIGAPVSGRILNSEHIGYRDGDFIQGLITDQISEEVMLVTNWRDWTHMGVIERTADGARYWVSTPCGRLTFDPTDSRISLIQIVHKRTAKGRAFAPVQPGAQIFAAIHARTKKASVTRSLEKQRPYSPHAA